jgi:hypothetical protein
MYKQSSDRNNEIFHALDRLFFYELMLSSLDHQSYDHFYEYHQNFLSKVSSELQTYFTPKLTHTHTHTKLKNLHCKHIATLD